LPDPAGDPAAAVAAVFSGVEFPADGEELEAEPFSAFSARRYDSLR
jgi:hypothetical protein